MYPEVPELIEEIEEQTTAMKEAHREEHGSRLTPASRVPGTADQLFRTISMIRRLESMLDTAAHKRTMETTEIR